jgi:predicted enzyme related to lactoylglutathione lyase
LARFTLTMLVSKDLARSRDFYRDVFGLKLGTDAPPHWVDFDLGNGVMFGLHPETDDLTVQPGSGSNGFVVDDVDGFVAGVKAHGIPVVSEPRDEPFGRLAILLDPDGYTVQVYTPKAAPHVGVDHNGAEETTVPA